MSDSDVGFLFLLPSQAVAPRWAEFQELLL